MKSTVGQIISLSVADKWLFIKAVILVVIIRPGLKVFGFKPMAKLIGYHNKPSVSNHIPFDNIERYHHLIKLIYRLPKSVFNCLAVSMSFWYLMKRKGIISDLKIGMKNEDNKFLAHAWLEYEGKPLTVDADINKQYISFSKPIF